MDKELLNYFKVMLVEDNSSPKVVNYQFMTKGILLNFVPTNQQIVAIKDYMRDANVSTLFSVDEVNNLSTDEKIVKQINHYALQFFTGYQFDVVRATDKGSNSIVVTLIQGVSKSELQTLIDDSLYSNRPVKDSKILAAIIKHYKLAYRVADIKNNELRVILFDVSKDKFTNGDDAVRYLVNMCSESDLLIKSKQVIESVKSNADKIATKFFTNHKLPLAQVYNRHRRLIMAVKVGTRSSATKSAINQISRLSKGEHVPVFAAKSKTFVSDVLNASKAQNFSALDKFSMKATDRVKVENLIKQSAKVNKPYDYANLDKFSMRDKLKILNLLEFKMHRMATDIFVIRNGKTHLAEDRPVYAPVQIEAVIDRVLRSIDNDLSDHLGGKIIVLPKDIDYGLPVSRKQSVGNLPFGTKVTMDSREISSGVYWRNDWGARDIDLSSVDHEGNRTGWGSRYGYNKEHGVSFSGDIVNAPDGAMEFLTSHSENYGLFANIFNGELGCKIQVLVGKKQRAQWIEETVIREELSLKARGNLVGFVDGKTFTVFYGRMNESRISAARNKVMIQKALSMKWSVKTLFDHFGYKYFEAAEKADFDLSYANFTYDKLETLFAV